MMDRETLEARLDAALARVKALRADGQRAENEALDLMIEIGTYSARKAEAERDAAVARAEAAEVEAERLRGLLSAERDGYAAGVADGRKAGGGEERDLIVACLRDFEKNGPPGLLSGAAQHIEAGCHWPDPLKPVWWQG
jgi:flagellar biosynthesis/type III secretory pathway protein FliH